MIRQFEQSSKYYDIFYRNRNYEEDVQALIQHIEFLCPNAQTILDVGCGSHEHCRYFGTKFRLDGIDVNEDFLSIARRKNANRVRPGKYYRASMESFELDMRYDVIMCLFSSIAYLLDQASLERAIAGFARHLTPTGVIIIEPWLAHSEMGRFEPSQLVREGTTHIARIASHKLNGALLNLSLNYLVYDDNDIHFFQEEHMMRFFDENNFVKAFCKADLAFSHLDPGLSSKRGLYIAVPSSHPQAEDVGLLSTS